MNDPRDDELRALFAAQRQDDAAASRSFAQTVAAARRRAQRRPRLAAPLHALAGAAALLVIAVALGTWGRGRRAPGDSLAVDLGAVRWAAPTDFLLRTPGSHLLRGMPSLEHVPALSAPAGRVTPTDRDS